MFIKTLPKKAQLSLAALGKDKFFEIFYLAGGSAVALHLGHRISVDLDFFTPKHFNVDSLGENLTKIGKVNTEQMVEDTFLGKLTDVKISFFRYPYPLLFKPTKLFNANIAHLLDIAVMKLDSISRRGSKRDFIDLYFIIKETKKPLADIIDLLLKKYKGLNYNVTHLILSLAYFEDAEPEIVPKMLKKISWDTVKDFFCEESKKLIHVETWK